MKKNLFLGLIALTALTVTGCSKDDVVSESPNINRAIEFGTYVGRDAQSRASVLDTTSLSNQGFGVFAYYTDDARYNGTAGSGSVLNFMNNQKVTSTDRTNWTYSPIKYWPNETNDSLTFFAYAPYDDADDINNTNGYDNIKFEVTKGDPIIDFAVNGTVKYQQDLVWSRTNNKDIIKNPNVDVGEKVIFNFAHALSRIGFTVKAITDDVTAGVPPKALDNNTFIVLKKVMLSSVAGVGNSEPTTGVFYTNGKLNLNHQSIATTAAPALWTDCTGAQTFTLADANFVGQTVDYSAAGISYDIAGFVLTENTSIINTGNSTKENPLNAADSFIMVIPQNLSSAGFYVYVEYDVVTIDESLTNKVSVVTNHISKKVDGLNFESGKAYTLNLQLGMTSVKVTASVDNWNDVSGTNVDLPINTPEP